MSKTPRRLLLFSLAVLVVCLVWAFWSTDLWPVVQGRASGEGDGAKAATVTDHGMATADIDAPASRSTLEPTDSAAEPEEYRRWLSGLRGRLVWEGSGEPIPGVEVRAVETWLDTVVQTLDSVRGVLGAGDPFVLRGAGRTDADGNFHIRGVHSRAFLLLAIGLGTDKAAVRAVDHAPGPGEMVDMGDVVLSERGSVAGKAIGPDGKPVAGARVRVLDLSSMLLLLGIQHYDPEGLIFLREGSYHLVFEVPPWVAKYDRLLPFGEARTAGDGSFLVKGVRPKRSTLMISKHGLATTTRTVRPQPLARLDLEPIEMGEGGTLEGCFRDAHGEPVRNVRVCAGSQLNLAPIGFLGKPVTVGQNGRFGLAGLPRGRLWLAYQRERGQPWQLAGPYSAGETIDIALEDLGTATIQVQDDRGTPIEEARFTLFVRDQAAWVPGYEQRIDARQHIFKDTGRAGRWWVRNLPAGKYTVVAEATGHALGAAILTVGKDGQDQPVVIQLSPAAPQEFLVLNQGAEPVAGARIYWDARTGRASQSELLWKTPLLLGNTDGKGVLEVRGLEGGASRFLCRHPGYALATSGDQVAQPGVPIRFVLGPGGHIRGSLTENRTHPASSHTLMASPRGELKARYGNFLMGRFTRSDPDGSFEFRHLDAGDWRVDVLADYGEQTSITEFLPYGGTPFRSRARREVTVTAGSTTFLHMEVSDDTQSRGRGSLVGTVHIGGRPAVGAWVETWSGGRHATVDATGSFALSGLADGRHWIGVGMPTAGLVMNHLWEGQITVRDGGQETLHLDVTPARGRIEVSDPAGNPLPGLLVEVSSQLATQGRRQGHVKIQAITDATGSVLLENLPEGRYRVRAGAGRQASWVFPPTNINLYGDSAATVRIRAVPVIEIVGEVEYDVSGLDEAGKKLATRHRPTWLVFQDHGHYIWGPVHRHGERCTFEIPGVAPGTYRFVNRSKIPWTTDDLVVPESGLRDKRVVLRAVKQKPEGR